MSVVLQETDRCCEIYYYSALLWRYLRNPKRNRELNIIEDAEAYNVYSAILDMEKPKGELLIADTTVPFNQCLDPTF